MRMTDVADAARKQLEKNTNKKVISPYNAKESGKREEDHGSKEIKD